MVVLFIFGVQQWAHTLCVRAICLLVERAAIYPVFSILLKNGPSRREPLLVVVVVRSTQQICPRNTNYKCVVSKTNVVLRDLLSLSRRHECCKNTRKRQHPKRTKAKCYFSNIEITKMTWANWNELLRAPCFTATTHSCTKSAKVAKLKSLCLSFCIFYQDGKVMLLLWMFYCCGELYATAAAVSTGKDVSCIVASPPLYSNTQIDRRYLATSRGCKKGTFSSPKNNLAIIGHHHT